MTARRASRTFAQVKSPLKAPALLVVVTSVGTEEQALDIAHHLVESQLAACVNILPGVKSVFRWKGKVQHESEFLDYGGRPMPILPFGSPIEEILPVS